MKSELLSFEGVSFKYRQRGGFFKSKDFYALRNISFSLYQGECLGVVGVNGCGKSTLLKLISGIYSADEGIVNKSTDSISLLTLSAGFDFNLDGVDNIYISGMLLGIEKNEIQKNINEIIEYSELGDFINNPVKTYSNGMKSRLGFSIATTLKSDLLLVDEVLGVGDAKFRAKAEATMLNKINGEQTTIIVSHSAQQIRKVCDRVIWIHKGEVVDSGCVDTVMTKYQDFLKAI